VWLARVPLPLDLLAMDWNLEPRLDGGLDLVPVEHRTTLTPTGTNAAARSHFVLFRAG